MSPRWKGKARDDSSNAYGSGGSDGIVLPLNAFTVANFEAVYTLPIQVGSPPQTFSVQVDTGSSDLWIASTSCSTQSCKQTGGALYDPSKAVPTEQNFQISYVQGRVSGPIVWDTVTIGGYEMDGQALAAASSVDAEPLAPLFSGVLGLALPLNSIISGTISPSTSSTFDGASVSSDLFGLAPAWAAPSYRFLAMTLARPDGGASAVPSLLGLGRHVPTSVVPDTSKVQYAGVSTTNAGGGPLFWQSKLTALTVYVDGVRKDVQLPASASSIVDSGTPVILTSVEIANGIYGALGIGPGSDGSYWVPCTTPLNMSVTLDSRSEISLHPLDLTFAGQTFSSTPTAATQLTNGTVSSASSNNMCMGMVQASSALANLADVVLGVPFMRAAYTVMAYDPPDSHGNFPNVSRGISPAIRPRLGLLGLVDPTTALQEFHTERVLNQALPVPSGSSNPTSDGPNRANVAVPAGHHLSVGVEVLIGLLGFAALVTLAFGGWWCVGRRRRAREERERVRGVYAGVGTDSEEKAEAMRREAAYILARAGTRESRYAPAEESIRASKYSAYRASKYGSERGTAYSDDTMRTAVEGDELGFVRPPHVRYDSRESRGSTLRYSSHDEEEPDATLVDRAPRDKGHSRSQTVDEADAGLARPLLAHTRGDSTGGWARVGSPVLPSQPSPPLPSIPLPQPPLPPQSQRPPSQLSQTQRPSSQLSQQRPPSTRSLSGPRPMSSASSRRAVIPPGNGSAASGLSTAGHDGAGS